jgi:hypothetical protein
MISVIVPTLRNRPDSLQRTLDSIEKNTHIKYEIIIADGGDCYSASMNNGIKKAKGDFLTIPGIADDIEVEPYCFDNIVEFMKLNNIDYGVFKIINPSGSLESYGGFVMPEAMNTTPDGVPDYAGYGLITRKGFETVGLMDEHFKPIYCLTPETRILKSNLDWVRLDSLSVGDELIGVSETSPKHKQRTYEPSVVTGVNKREAECVKITMSDGRSVTCTLDHRWLTKQIKGNMPYAWRRTDELRVGHRISSPLRVWDKADDFELGWLSGILDGEGSLHKTKKLRAVTISQKDGLVLRKAKGILEKMGIHYTICFQKEQQVQVLYISCRRDVMELLGRLKPLRLMEQSPNMWGQSTLRSRIYKNDLRIVSIEQVGKKEVVSIETSTHTYIAEGMISHNCEDADYGLRVHEAGLRVGVCAGAVLRHHHEQAGRVFDYHHNKEYLWKKHRL